MSGLTESDATTKTHAGALPSVFNCNLRRTVPAKGTTNFLRISSSLDERSVSALSCKVLEATSTLPVSLAWLIPTAAIEDRTVADTSIAGIFMVAALIEQYFAGAGVIHDVIINADVPDSPAKQA